MAESVAEPSMKRIAIGQVRQETNSFNPVLTERSHFEDYGLVRGADIVERYGDVGELSGFTELPKILGSPVEWVGLCRAVTWSGGPLAAGLLAELIEMTVQPLRAGAVDGVLLSLHGAQSAVDDPDVSGRVLEAIRAAIGPATPLVATLDLHANLTPLMVRSADVLVGYHTHPHVDEDTTGARAAAVLARLLDTAERPAVNAWKMPMVHNGDGRATDRGIQRDLWRRIVAAEAADDVASVGLYPVQPWLDAPHLGWTFYQAYWGAEPPMDPQSVARECWATRAYSEAERFITPDRLVAAARAIDGGPVAVSEFHDATNSGAPGDSTHLLAALLDEPIGAGGALAFCVDPRVGRPLHAGRRGRHGGPEPGRQARPVLEAAGGERAGGEAGHAGLPAERPRRPQLPGRHGAHGAYPRGRGHRGAGGEERPRQLPTPVRGRGGRSAGLQDRARQEPGGLPATTMSRSRRASCSAPLPGSASPYLDRFRFTQTTRPLYPWDDLTDMEQAGWAGPMDR